MANWQPVSVPDFCPTCGVYWECECGVVPAEEARGQFIPELPPSSLGEKLMRDFSAQPPVPDGVLEIAARMNISPKDVTDEMTRIQEERLAMTFADNVRKSLGEVELAEGEPPPAYS